MTKRSLRKPGGSADERFASAAQAFNAGNFTEAARICDELIRKDPHYANAFNLRGALFRAAGAPAQAIRSIARAIQLDATNAAFHYNMGIAVDATGDRVQALGHFKRVHALDPTLITTDALVAWFMQLGRAEADAVNFAGAAAAFHQGLALDPKAIDMDLFRNIRSSAAAKVYEEILRTHPDNIPVLEALAHINLLVGDAQACREKLSQVDAFYGRGDTDGTHIQNIYSAGLVATRTQPLYRRRLRFSKLVEVFDTVRGLDGDIAECGCLKGLSAYILASRARDHEQGFRGAGFHIFDSFEGLSAPVAADLDGADDRVRPNLKKGTFAASLDLVKGNLVDFPHIQFYPGWIPERFPEVADRRFQFLNLDVDLYQPTKDAIAFFYPRLVAGGVIISDDYNWPGCKTAIEECRAEFGFTVALTEFDQAIIRKA